MKLTIFINKKYHSLLSKNEITQFLQGLGKEKKFGGLRINKYITQTTESTFILQQRSYGLDGFTLEKFPFVKGEFLSEKPTTLNIQIKPDYFSVGFFCVFALVFAIAIVFAKHGTINGVYRVLTITDRLWFSLGRDRHAVVLLLFANSTNQESRKMDY